MNTNDSVSGPINLGNPIEFTINQLANKVVKLACSQSEISYLPLPKDDPKQRKPDINLAETKLSWSPKVDLENGLLKTIEYFKKLV